MVPGVPRYHEANCILIRFMADDDVQKMTVHEAAEAGCTPAEPASPTNPPLNPPVSSPSPVLSPRGSANFS